MTRLYGIPNCDTVKKARRWLEQQQQDVEFHDFRKDGLELEQIQTWLEQVGVELLLNKRSTTWKQLSDDEKAQAQTAQCAALLQAKPTLIKRPVLDIDGDIHIGFKAELYSQIFS
ncbi:ArsC family reductase [Agaribacterium haliotis]|uniref:ArsC family reductase n=1 Tax=Agaribacterium haliotis TaxID=2013869 RepID=UPI000BB555E2|nr:ArsC family reductase [Agaribacterium haliotis]